MDVLHLFPEQRDLLIQALMKFAPVLAPLRAPSLSFNLLKLHQDAEERWNISIPLFIEI